MTQLEHFCAGFLCTDVDREGTMTGANLAWFRRLRDATSHPIIAAGGIKTRREIAALEKMRSEEHTSELQSQSNLVCRLLLEKKKKKKKTQKNIKHKYIHIQVHHPNETTASIV